MADNQTKKAKPAKHPCIRCKREVTKNEKSVQCQTCQFWVHAKCQDITDDQFKMLVEQPGFCWNCDSCLASAARLEKLVAAYEVRVKQVEQVSAKNSSEIKRVDGEVAQLRKDLEMEKKRNREAEEKRENKYMTADEFRDRESRKLNVILHRVEEPGDEIKGGEERKKIDMEQCIKIFKALGLEKECEDEMKICRRVGEKGDTPRPLVVGLTMEDTKRKLLQRAKNLRNTEFSEVGIVPDLTVQQRKEEQDMYEEAERRNEEELTEEDRAKNLTWTVAGPRGQKKILKLVERQWDWPGRGRGGTSTRSRGFRGSTGPPRRGGVATGANAAPMTTRPELLLPTRNRLTSAKRTREEREDQMSEAEEEELEEGAEGEVTRSPLRKK